MFCSLLLIKGLFFKKRPTDYNPISFWIVTVQDWPKTNSAKAYCPLGTVDISSVVYIDKLLVENSKKVCVFDNQRS